jgi:hypothetical protein
MRLGSDGAPRLSSRVSHASSLRTLHAAGGRGVAVFVTLTAPNSGVIVRVRAKEC